MRNLEQNLKWRRADLDAETPVLMQAWQWGQKDTCGLYDPDNLGLNPNSGSHLLGDFGKVLNPFKSQLPQLKNGKT